MKKPLNLHKHPELTIIIIMTIINLKTTMTLQNIANNNDIDTLLEVIKRLGASVIKERNLITINATRLTNIEIPLKLLTKRNITVYLLPILTNIFNYNNILLDKEKSIYPIIHITNLMEYFGINTNFDNSHIISQRIRDVNNVIININNLGTSYYTKELTILAIILGSNLSKPIMIINPSVTKEAKVLIKYLNNHGINIVCSKDQIDIN